MREILFRAQRKNMWERLGRWVYGCGAEQRNFGCETVEGTVGQYIGLEDKNGTKIFEDDVLRYRYAGLDLIGAVKYIVAANCSYETVGVNEHEFGFKILPCPARLEVIGNIHDNPEYTAVSKK